MELLLQERKVLIWRTRRCSEHFSMKRKLVTVLTLWHWSPRVAPPARQMVWQDAAEGGKGSAGILGRKRLKPHNRAAAQRNRKGLISNQILGVREKDARLRCKANEAMNYKPACTARFCRTLLLKVVVVNVILKSRGSHTICWPRDRKLIHPGLHRRKRPRKSKKRLQGRRAYPGRT